MGFLEFVSQKGPEDGNDGVGKVGRAVMQCELGNGHVLKTLCQHLDWQGTDFRDCFPK